MANQWGSAQDPRLGGNGQMPPPPNNMPAIGQQPSSTASPYASGQMPAPPAGNMNALNPTQPNQQQGGMGQSPWSTPPPITPPTIGQNMPENGGQIDAMWNPQGYSSGTQFGGQSTTGAQAGAADYAGVQGFADAAYDESRRYLDPQQDQQNRRMDQELINKGIDPRSDMGQQMANQLSMQQNDQNTSAAFNAMGFGQGIQDQMFNQSFKNTQQAGEMAQGNWRNQQTNQNVYAGKYGDELQSNLGWGNIGLGYNNADVDRYRGDQQYNLGLADNEVRRQQQDWNETVGWDNMDYRNNLFNQNQQNWKDTITNSMITGNQPPYGGGGQTNQGNNVDPWLNWMRSGGAM